MLTKQQILTIGVLCVVALGLGYWSGPFKKDSGQRTEVVAPTIITNVVTNIVTVQPKPTPTPTPASVKPTPAPVKAPPNIVPANTFNPIIEEKIRFQLKKPTGELTKADYEEVTRLRLDGNQLTEFPKGLEKLTKLKVLYLHINQLTEFPKGLEKLTKLERLNLENNQLTDVKGLEKLNQLEWLNLSNNPDLTKAQIAELQKALPNCKISSNPTK